MKKTFFILLIVMQYISIVCNGQTTVTPNKAYDYVNGIGVNIHLRYTNIYYNSFYNIIYPRLKELGVKHIRDMVPYPALVNGSRTWMSDTLCKRLLRLYDSLDIKAMYVLGGGSIVADSTQYRDSAQYLTIFQTVPRLAETVDYLEGYNEPDNNGNLYSLYPTNWDTITYKIQKGLWTKAHNMPELAGVKIVGPSLIYYGNYGTQLARAEQVGAIQPYISNYFDYDDLHMYDFGNDNTKMFPGSKYDTREKYLDTIRHSKSWIVSEAGYENALNYNRPDSPNYASVDAHYLSELASGKYYSVLFMEMFKRGATRMYAYEFADQNTSLQGQKEDNFGLIHTDGTPKPAFIAIKNTLSILKDTDSAFTPSPINFSMSGDTSGIRYSLYQKKNGKIYFALWQGIGAGVCYDFLNFTDLPADSQSVKITLPFIASKVNVYQPLNSAIPLYTYTNKDTINLDVPDHLLLVEIDTSTAMLPEQSKIYVKADAVGGNDGTSWTNAYTSLSFAITAAVSGDSIFVAKGIYKPSSYFVMKEGVKMFGGFAGTETSLNERIFGTTSADSSILQGNGNRVISNNFTSASPMTAASVLDGFTVTGGNTATSAGGMYNSYASPIINNCIFSDNTSTGSSGSGCMWNSNASPVITNCIFSENAATAGPGGAIRNNTSSSIIRDCIFSGNTAVTYGGGIYNINSVPAIVNCIFAGDTASSGGAIYNASSSPGVINSTFSSNKANSGGAIYNNSASSTPIITNCIIYGNSSGITGSGVPTITYSDVQDGLFNGAGNISENPLFADAPLYNTAPFVGGDYTLQNGSPCIDKGRYDTAGLDIGSTDIAGNIRLVNDTIDMGAYEYQGSVTPVLLTGLLGSLQNNIVQLKWKTGVETNFNHFEIEKSTNGSSFKTQAKILAKGSNSTYSYDIPQADAKAYYKLRIVGNDGGSRYSGIISMLRKVSNTVVTVYPNPANTYLNINVADVDNINIYNAFGKLIKVQTLQIGKNTIDISGFDKGTYFGIINGQKIKFLKK